MDKIERWCFLAKEKRNRERKEESLNFVQTNFIALCGCFIGLVLNCQVKLQTPIKTFKPNLSDSRNHFIFQ